MSLDHALEAYKDTTEVIKYDEITGAEADYIMSKLEEVFAELKERRE